jgi:hypothetical protein
MKSAVPYIFTIVIIFINLIFIRYIHLELLTIILLLGVFNIMTSPILYSFITIKSIISNPTEKYNVFNNSNSKVAKKTTQTINELFYLLKQPAIILLCFFPFLFLLNPKVNITLFVCINIVFMFFALLNLLLISILMKSFYLKKFSVLISIIGILFSTIAATINLTNKNIFNITISLVIISFLSILLILYFINKKLKND